MIHICVCGGHEGQLRPEKKVYFTLFGACELVRPTVARQILFQRRQQREPHPEIQRHFFLTICAGAEIKAPTLAEEFIDLREMVNSGALSMDDWDACMADLGRTDIAITSVTLMGGFSEYVLPSENEEVESLALQQHLGTIPDEAVQVLKYGVGLRDAERRAAIRKALTTTF